MPLKVRGTCKVMPGIGCHMSNAMWSTNNKATVARADTSQVQTYTGSTDQTIKYRWRGHDYDMRHPGKSGTTLSSYIHKLTSRTRNRLHPEIGDSQKGKPLEPHHQYLQIMYPRETPYPFPS